MTKKIQTKTEKLQNWYESEIEKDNVDLETEKLSFIDEIKKMKKEDILPKNPENEKLSLWKRIKKVLLGT
jgi:hypothetical protein